MDYMIEISNDYPDLAVAEIESLFEINIKNYISSYYFVKKEINISKLKRLGLTKKVYKILQKFNSGGENEFLQNINLDLIKNSYKINIINFENAGKNTQNIANKIYNKLKNPQVDVNNPNHNYVLLWSLSEVRLCEEIYTNTDKTQDRRSHLKKHNHPTSIHPKIAKAMINLGAKKSFLDPFCGAGGIVIEGKIMGLKVRGYDIDNIMIKRARENAQEMNLNILFEQKDSLQIAEQCESIITDMPFGKNSKISKDIIKLYEEFFKKADQLTETLVVGSSDKMDIESYLDDTRWELKKKFKIYIHKTMTRVISVLKRSDKEYW